MKLVLQIEPRSINKSLLAGKCKLCEIFRGICDIYREKYSMNYEFTNTENIGVLHKTKKLAMI